MHGEGTGVVAGSGAASGMGPGVMARNEERGAIVASCAALVGGVPKIVKLHLGARDRFELMLALGPLPASIWPAHRRDGWSRSGRLR